MNNLKLNYVFRNLGFRSPISPLGMTKLGRSFCAKPHSTVSTPVFLHDIYSFVVHPRKLTEFNGLFLRDER